ncbi:MAG: MerR family transcriptional regulator [Candidatus Tectomicrobia bacterium]|nr:MerR family transcriptional regulator [Candidatus Tectomicrobia bacterium]
MAHYTISQLARAAGVPTSTLRYYERVGLVCPTGRAENNYRVYTRDMLQRVHFIRAAQATGLTLDDVRTLLALNDGEMALCQEVQPLIAKRLDEVSQRLKEMRQVQRILQSMLAQCREQEPDALCHVVDQFSAEPR